MEQILIYWNLVVIAGALLMVFLMFVNYIEEKRHCWDKFDEILTERKGTEIKPEQFKHRIIFKNIPGCKSWDIIDFGFKRLIYFRIYLKYEPFVRHKLFDWQVGGLIRKAAIIGNDVYIAIVEQYEKFPRYTVRDRALLLSASVNVNYSLGVWPTNQEERMALPPLLMPVQISAAESHTSRAITFRTADEAPPSKYIEAVANFADDVYELYHTTDMEELFSGMIPGIDFTHAPWAFILNDGIACLRVSENARNKWPQFITAFEGLVVNLYDDTERRLQTL